MKRAFYRAVILGRLPQTSAWFPAAAGEASSRAAPLLQSGDKPVTGTTSPTGAVSASYYQVTVSQPSRTAANCCRITGQGLDMEVVPGR